VLQEIDLFGLPVKTFGLFFALNFAAWGLLAARRFRELGKPVDWAFELVIVALIGGLVGARAYWLLQQGEAPDLGDIFGGSGLTWYGGLLGGTAAVLVWAWRRDFFGLQLLDFAGPGLALGYAVGRIGCQVSGDGDYGKEWDGPWAMGYADGVVPTAPGVTVHPSPIYESLVMASLAVVLWSLRDRVRPGLLMAGYLVGAGLERFLVEFVRRNEEIAAGLTAAQWESLVLLFAGLVWFAVVRQRHGSWSLPGDERDAALEARARNLQAA
jgi:phosphatidylglycerol:prolipoprotein diacylglycerol transferase